MQIAAQDAVAPTRRAILPNGVPAHLTTYFGTNFAMRTAETPPPPGPEVIYPMGFLVEQGADTLVQAHFHAANQWQVVVGGEGALGRHPVAPVAIHYTNAFSSYGPLRAGPEGLHYFTLRNGYDPGARYVPDAAHEMRGRPRQFREAKAAAGPPASAAALAALAAPVADILVPMAADGLAAWRHRLPPGAGLRGPDPMQGEGQYWVVTAGSLTLAEAVLPRLSCAFIFPADGPAEVLAGAGGAELLVLQYPRGRAHLGPA
jgi:hypothetical protein